MAQIKTLKFNDNVTQVTNSYTVGTYTYSLPNIEIGTTHIADECGRMILHTYSSYGDVEVKEVCGNTTVSMCADPSSGNFIFFYEGGNPYIGVGEKCGNFAVTDMCGNELLTYPCTNNEDTAPALHFVYGSDVGCQIAEHCGSVCLYEHCGFRVFSASQAGLTLPWGYNVSDYCGTFSVHDNCGNEILGLKDGASIQLEYFALTDTSCGDFCIFDTCGNKRFTIPNGRKVEADTNGFLKLVSDH